MGKNTQPLFYYKPSMPYIESRVAINSFQCYEKHTHPTLSIGIIDKGRSIYQNHKQKQIINKGALVIINPEEVHSCNPNLLESWSYKMFNINPDWLGTLQNEILDNGKSYTSFSKTMLNSPFLYNKFQLVFKYLTSQVDDNIKEEVLLEFLGDVILASCPDDFKKHRELSFNKSFKLQQIKDYIYENAKSKLSLEDLMTLSGYSRYYLVRAFKNEFGLSPHAYQIDRRVNIAKEYLKKGFGLSETAHDVGFSDQSHLQRCFKNRVAATPKQYQKGILTVAVA